MSDFQAKIKYIFFPLVILTTICTVGYTFLNWLLVIKFNLFSLNENVIEFFIPLILVVILVAIWINPRIRLLDFYKGNGNYPFLYNMIAGIVILIPTICAQTYITKATGKLTYLNNISEINKLVATKYYCIKNYHVDKNHIEFVNSFNVSGKHSEYFNMSIYVILPIRINQEDTAKLCYSWLGIEYSEQISNSTSQAEKDSAYKDFADNCQWRFDTTNFNQFVYLERIGNSDDKTNYLKAVNQSSYFLNKSQVILLPIHEAFENRVTASLNGMIYSYFIGLLFWFVILLNPLIDKRRVYEFQKGEYYVVENIDFLEWFIPNRKVFVTPLLIDINLLIFLIMIFCGYGFNSFQSQDLLDLGGNYGPSTIGGEWWRLITSVFLHGGIMHVFSNICGLALIGALLESLVGKFLFLFVYIISGVIGSLASIYWHLPPVVGVGASGAIFGMYGFFIAATLTKSITKEFEFGMLVLALIFVGFNLLMGLAGNVDNAAHFGGLISGFVIGILLHPIVKNLHPDEHY